MDGYMYVYVFIANVYAFPFYPKTLLAKFPMVWLHNVHLNALTDINANNKKDVRLHEFVRLVDFQVSGLKN
jgi:hypothetical protein